MNKKTVKRESWFHILRLRTIGGKIFYILLVGLFIRLLLLFLTPFVVETDGVVYLRMAESILSGDIHEAMATLSMSHMIYHPLYPLLIKIISFPFPVGSLELSGMIVSILASLLLALPVFLLARRFYNDEVGYISALLVGIYPFLVDCSFMVHTEVTMTLFAIVGVWCIWLALEGRLLWSFVAGIIFGMAYLTRPEGLIYVLLAVVIILLLSYFRKSKRVSKYTFVKAFLLLIGFAIMASSYLIYLRKDYGRWLISSYIPFYGSAGVLSQLPHLSGFPQLSSLKPIMAYTAQVWYKDYTRSFSEAFYPIMLILAGLGFLGSPWDRKRMERNIFLALFLIPPLLTAFLRESSPRRFICVIPILVIWTANGVTVLQNWLHNSVEGANFEKDSWIRRLLLKKWVVLAVLLLSLAPMILLPLVGNALNEIPI
jgi:4-amino-4-deoxy-L-arabinose transferase-like glycosyltransferase